MSNEQTTPATLLREMIQCTIEKRPLDQAVMQGSPRETQLASEAEEMFARREIASDLLKCLFPEGVPTDSTFYKKLKDLHLRLGWREPSHRVTGLLFLTALQHLSQQDAEALLKEFSRIRDEDLIYALESLPTVVAELGLRTAFFSEWFPTLVRRSPVIHTALWTSLGVYCERQTNEACNALELLLAGDTEEHVAVGAYILGTIRTLELTGTTAEKFNSLEAKALAGMGKNVRAIYDRSWIQTALLGKMRGADLEGLLSRLETASVDETAFLIVCRCLLSPLLSSECLTLGVDWLKANVSGNISPEAKYRVVEYAALLPKQRREEAATLVSLVQPILADHTGIWARVELFLVGLLQDDIQGFEEFCLKLAAVNARHWLTVLRKGKSFRWLLSEMHGKALGNLVSQLIFSQSRASRKLGLFLFAELEINAAPGPLVSTVSADSVKIALYELQCSIMSGSSTARYLVMLVPFVQGMDAKFQEEFFEELVRQLKNYGGACREEFKRRVDEYPLLKKALEKADAYLNALRNIQGSGVNAMEVAGYRQAIRTHSRKWSNDISKGTKEASVFMQMFKTVQLLYGKTWSSFHDGKLGGSSELKHISSSVELPRLEIVDPEDMALRRLYARKMIENLKGIDQSEFEGEV